jgi:hypothetical protein
VRMSLREIKRKRQRIVRERKWKERGEKERKETDRDIETNK